MTADHDVIVVGAGICGASAAHHLAQRGRDLLVLDRGDIAGATTSAGQGNVLLCDKPAGPLRQLTVYGRALWQALGERYRDVHVARVGALLLGDAASPPAPLALDAEATAALEPELCVGVVAAHEPGDLIVDAPAMTRALLGEVAVRTGVEVVAVAAGEVTLDDGTRLTARDVVVCAGPWSARLAPIPVEPRKGQLVALTAPVDRRIVHRTVIEGAYLDAVASDEPELQLASVVQPSLDGREILVGSSRLHAGFDDTVDVDVSRAMLGRAIRWVPALAELAVTRAWAGLRPWLPDGLPAIGAFGPGLWASTGHEGAGVCLGPVSGLLLAQLMSDQAPLVDPSPFDPRRF